VLGTAPIVFNTYFSVQVSVAINAWYGPFYDLIQQALAKTAPVTAAHPTRACAASPASPSWLSRWAC